MNEAPQEYPGSGPGRDRWILARRAARVGADPWTPNAAFAEVELAAERKLIQSAVLLLASRECPWRCVMCDLWQGALAGRTPVGALPAQVRAGLARLGIPPGQAAGFRQIKLYNGGSYFDDGAAPPADDPVMATLARPFRNVVVECHPRLVRDRVVRFRDLLAAEGDGERATLEVAMGLETVHEAALERLNKRMTLEDFGRAAAFLAGHGVAVRAFVILQPPFVPPEESVEWALRSVRFAVECGAGVVSIIPGRLGNGATESLQASGHFKVPGLSQLEAVLEAAIRRGGGERVFADLWEAERLSGCASCFEARRHRLEAMNRTQGVVGAVRCSRCGGST